MFVCFSISLTVFAMVETSENNSHVQSCTDVHFSTTKSITNLCKFDLNDQHGRLLLEFSVIVHNYGN
ncbi:hypothetical protein M758_7G076800 [Ceratodon purpureus]|nr:hypothetical protein M758_7G076800 [Ceratodon purpureus]